MMAKMATSGVKRQPPAIRGNRLGVPNKIPAAVKDMILKALNDAGEEIEPGAGGIAYLKQQSKENPVAFLALVGKVLPMQITVDRAPQVMDLSGLSQADLLEMERILKLIPGHDDEAAAIARYEADPPSIEDDDAG